MTKVKTLTISCADLGEDVTYVAYEDYAALKAECENWSNQCAELIKQRDAVAAENASLKSFIEDECYTLGGDWASDGVPDDARLSMPDAPATDSYANQLRAEGAVRVGASIRACSHEFPDSAQDIVEECAMIAVNRAADLLSAGK